MNSKLWIRKALSTCLAVAIIATYSMVALAGSEKVVGELFISANNTNGETPSVIVNGEAAQNGRSIFSSSTIATPENAGAIINLGKVGKIALDPNTKLVLSFNENGINGDLLAGQITVLNASNNVNVKTIDGNTANLKSGESVAATTGKAKDDAGSGGGNGWVVWALVFGGAVAGIVIAASTNNNNIQIGGGSTLVSPTR